MEKKRMNLTEEEKWKICQISRCGHRCPIKARIGKFSFCMLNTKNDVFNSFFLNKVVKIPEIR